MVVREENILFFRLGDFGWEGCYSMYKYFFNSYIYIVILFERKFKFYFEEFCFIERNKNGFNYCIYYFFFLLYVY